MLRSCAYCGRLHEQGKECPKKPKRLFSKNSRAAKFRSSSIWKNKSQEIRRRDMGLCRVCLSQGLIETHGIEVHHITPLEEDMGCGLEDGELVSLCASHHKEAERGRSAGNGSRNWRGSPPGVIGHEK